MPDERHGTRMRGAALAAGVASAVALGLPHIGAAAEDWRLWANHRIQNPEVAVAPDGEAVAVDTGSVFVERQDGGGFTSPAAFFASVNPAGSGRVDQYPVSEDLSVAKVAVAGRVPLALIPTEVVDQEGRRRGGFQLVEWTRSADGSWSASGPGPEVPGGREFFEDIEVDAAPDGTAVAAWTNGGSVRAAVRTPAGEWSPTRLLHLCRGDCDELDVDVARDGHAAVSWRSTVRPRVTIGQILVATLPTGSTHFSRLQRASTARRVWGPEVAAGPAGRAVVVWGQGGSRALFTRVRSAKGWGPKRRLALRAAERDVAMDGAGRALATWVGWPRGRPRAHALQYARLGVRRAAFGRARAHSRQPGIETLLAEVGASGAGLVAWGRAGRVRAATFSARSRLRTQSVVGTTSLGLERDRTLAAAVNARGQAAILWLTARGGTIGRSHIR